MANLKDPLHSLDARGTISKAISFVKRRGQNIAKEKPEIKDVQSPAQLSWRHMYQKCAALWHTLSGAEQADWNSLGGIKHMTGFAYWQSQCLRPNPGIYLPLQGGTMSGDIDMAKNRILKLPAPADLQEAFRLSEYATYVLPYLLREGARVYHSANQSIPNNTLTILAFNSEVYDTDSIHDLVTNNSRLTCRTSGKYLITTTIIWSANPVGRRMVRILKNGAVAQYGNQHYGQGAEVTIQPAVTILDLDIGDYIEVNVFQDHGAPLSVWLIFTFYTTFAMQRIGA